MSIAARLKRLETAARERQGAGFVFVVQCASDDPDELRAAAEAELGDLDQLPRGCALARGKLTPAEQAEHEQQEALRDVDAADGGLADLSIPKAVRDAFWNVDPMPDAPEGLWWSYGDRRQVVLRDGELFAFDEILSWQFLLGVTHHPFSRGMGEIALRDATPEQLQAAVERYRQLTAYTLRPLGEAVRMPAKLNWSNQQHAAPAPRARPATGATLH